MTLAIFFPTAPDALFCDALESAQARMRPGMRLYCNGQRLAAFRQAPAGWALIGAAK